MIVQEEEDQRNSVCIYLDIQLIGVQREINFAIHNNTSRMFTIGSLHDNQHYTYLESLLIQINPKQDQSLFQLHANIPQLKSQRKKILQKFSQFNTKIHEQKLGRGDVQLSLSFLLKRPLNMYLKQLQNIKLKIVLQKLLQIINIQKQTTNKAQFQLKLINPKASMLLDKSTINAIQIFSKQMQKKIISSNNTLYEIFNKCKTSFGTRCLKRWMKQPLQNKDQLQARLDKIEFFISNSVVKNLIQNQLKKLPDLDRLYFVFYKVAAGKKTRCEVSDLIKIYRVVQSLIQLVHNLQSKQLDNVIAQVYEKIKKNVNIISKISKMIEKGIDMSGSRDNQFYVKPQTQATLEVIMKQKKQIQLQINLELNKVSKYLSLEVQKVPSNTHKYVFQANKKLAINLVKESAGYKFLTAKQTKITFVTQNLTHYCQRLRVVQQQYKNQQQVLLRRMFQLVAGYYPVMQQLSFILSQLDVLTTIATIVSTSTGVWCRPTFSNHISGKAMRHPCIKNCVPNNCEMKQHKTIVLTGPNMGGKSTYIRTVGVNVYLAHIGCYVPASEFQTPIVDAIITRVGASDLQVKGISTFMSEMLESSCMLETSTKNSLVLIDELGRGTSTCEGFGIAWGICEYLHKNINPYCLFATHFHEMTKMQPQIPGVKNMFTMCKVQNGKLVLQYKVEQGKMQKSYGIQVMKILKFPQNLINEAENYLKYYECDEKVDEQIQNLTDDQKQRILDVYEQMQDKLTHTNFGNHDQIYRYYRSKMNEIVRSC